jgi:hypothetical protein
VAWIAKATEASNVLSSQLHLNLLNRRRLAKGDVQTSPARFPLDASTISERAPTPRNERATAVAEHEADGA